MSTKVQPIDTQHRALAKALLLDIKEMVGKARDQFKNSDQHVRANLYRGMQRSGRKPRLSLPLDGLMRHQEAVEDRRLAHRQLQVLVPAMRKLNAGFQKGDTFEAGKSATLRNISLTLISYAIKSSQFKSSPESHVSAYIWNNHAKLFSNDVPESVLQSSLLPKTPPERKLAEKSLLFNKIVAITPMDDKELRLLRYLFNQQ